MKTLLLPAAALFSAVAGAGAQQTVLVPWNHEWTCMHPMGSFPDVPPGGDPDFDATWHLAAPEFAVNYNGPAFGADPPLTGVATNLSSYDSRRSSGPFGYDVIDYFNVPGAEFTGFGDNDGNAATGIAGRLTAPGTAAPGQRRAAYFRSTFTVPAGSGFMILPRLRYLIDDGAYLYLDGELIAAINMAATTPANRDEYKGTPEILAAGSIAESTIQSLNLNQPAGTLVAAGNARIVKQINSLAEGEHTLAVSVRSNSLTSSDMIMALEFTADIGCTMTATPGTVSRHDSGTPYVPGDDTFSFDATVAGFNAGANWTSDDPAVPAGTYDTPARFGPYPVSSGAKTVTFTSAFSPPCTAQVTVAPPGGVLQAAAQSFVRQQQGTVDPADDTFTTAVLVSGQFVSSAWKIVSTTPAAAAAGTPPAGTSGAVTSFGPYSAGSAPVTVTLADAADPSIRTQIVLAPQAFIGSRAFGGLTFPFLSAAPLPAQWVATTGVSPVITMANAGGDIWREFRSPVFDLTTTGAVGFSAELVARETSAGSNFEAVDAFRAKLIVTSAAGGSEVNLTGPYDTDANGMVNGGGTPYDPAGDEFNLKREAVAATINNVLRLESVIPAGADSVQLVIEAKGIDGNEFFDVRKISFNDQCAFAATVTGVTRNLNGQPGNPAAHTVDFVLRGTPSGVVSAAGWDVTFNRLGIPVAGTSVTGGAWNTNVMVTGLPAEGGPITAILRDRADASCFTGINITAAAPPRLMGTLTLGTGSTGIYSSGPPTGWVPAAAGLEMNAAAAISDFSSETVDLSAATGPVAFSLTLEAEDTSTGSNFEDPDIFMAELVLSDGTASSTVNLVQSLDKNANNQMNGSTNAVYDAATDEFNPAASAVSVQLKNTFTLTHSIPDNIVSATLHIRARVDAASEFLRMRDISWTGTGAPPGSTDSDGDGISDADELLAGTNPTNAASSLRVSSLTAAGANAFNAEFPTVTGRFYQGYLSPDLKVWTKDTTHAVITGDGNPAVWPVTSGPAAARFFRIAVGTGDGGFPGTLP